MFPKLVAVLFYVMALFSMALPVGADTIRQSIWRPIGTPDPIYTTTTAKGNVIAAAFDTLVTYDRQGQLVPNQARSWTLSEDGKTYRFELRDDIFWTDGAPVIAQDYVLNFRRILNPGLNDGPKPSYMLDMVRNARAVRLGELPTEALGVRAIGPKTLEIELDSPASYFVSAMAYAPMVAAPSHILKSEQDPSWVTQAPFVSNGRYRIVSIDDTGARLQRREDHWQKAEFEELEFVLYSDQSKIFQDILDKKLDLAVGITRKQDDWVSQAFADKVRDHQLDGTSYGVFNTLNRKFADPGVRQALRLAIDRRALARSIGLPAEFAAHSFTPPQMFGAMAPAIPAWHSEPMHLRQAEARQLLAEAGYDASSPLQVEIIAATVNDNADLAVAIQAMWHAIGVAADVNTLNGGELSRRLVANEYEFGIVHWVGDYADPMTFLGLVQSGGSKNHSDWSSKRYDDLLTLALATTDTAERMAIYGQMEAIIDAEAPLTPLTHLMMKVVRSDRIGDYILQGSKVIDRYQKP